MRPARLLSLSLPFLLLQIPDSLAGELADRAVGVDLAAREAALKELEGMGAGAVPELQEALGRRGAGGKLAVLRLLARTEGGAATEALVQALSLERPVAFSAACVLAEQGDARAVPALREALGYAQPLERVQAARALGQLRSGEAVGDLIALLADEHEQVRSAAITALGDVTLQDFDYDPRSPAYALPLAAEEQAELDAITQWRGEQFEKLKEGRYTHLDGRELANIPPSSRADYEAQITRRSADKWNAFRAKFEGGRREAGASSVTLWRAWWETHRGESPADWLRAGLSHEKPAVRCLAADQISRGELKDFLPDLEGVLKGETDVGAVRAQARALASFRDKAAVEALVVLLERLDKEVAKAKAVRSVPAENAANEIVAVVDRALIDLTGIEGVAPSGAGWREWWTRAQPFFECHRVLMMGLRMEYAVKAVRASSGSCTLEVLRWIPSESRWIRAPFEVMAGQPVGQAAVEVMDKHNLPVQIDLLPGLVLEAVERKVVEIRKRPLKRETLWRITLGVVDPLKPDEKGRRRAELLLPAS